MSVNKNNNRCNKIALSRLAAGVLAAGLASTSGQVMAFSIDTENPDLRVRWDNTVKYNIGWRMEGRDDRLGDNWVSQATNHGWDKGDIVTNRVDILSEFDMVHKMNHGFRVSAAAWNDFAFDDVEGNPAYQAAGLGTAYPNNRFTSDVERYYKRSGEILDAFVFTRLDVGTVPINVRAGRHNVYWGESMFTFGNSIAYGQGPLDLRKATSTPGVEAKELFLPQTQISASAQLTDNVSVSANYYLEWDAHRLPEGGTYLGGSDLSFLGGTDYLGLPVVGDLDHGPGEKPDDRGSWGINTHIRSELLGGTIGLYYRNFDDRNPAMVMAPDSSYMYNAYAEDVKLYGISYARLLGAISVGAELSRREGTSLASNSAGLATGDTWHGLLNMVAFIGQTSVFDSASLSAELSYSRLDSVDGSTRQFFNHESGRYGGCDAGRKGGCATDDSLGFQVSFVPTWYQVYPGIDMTAPINYGQGITGNSPTPLGTAENGGSWSVGVGLDIHAKYEVDLAYNDYFGDYTKGANPLAAVPGVEDVVWENNSGSGIMHDRGWLSLTFKTAF
ncbi:DUF1302 domain-containing protein [Pseudomonas sp. OIL-1]|uniref:DUF1302 domain-containing protein n=1 Tax=Pseudomonas sp. OIL-1 TaxID=2706126 RepID=UPI0013A78CAA|nr:DUF1302 family protein [Pseudomonas sp. OIL-1]QIB51170.1 DUF1302 domain-containing protein [Pseudomonas sp. OIL-1]